MIHTEEARLLRTFGRRCPQMHVRAGSVIVCKVDLVIQGLRFHACPVTISRLALSLSLRRPASLVHPQPITLRH